MSILDLSVLGLLADQPLHGYELKKRLATLTGGRSGVSFGSLYPALKRLDRAELVESGHTDARPHIPMTGSLGAEVAAMRENSPAQTQKSRRNRKVYAITATGQARLVELLAKQASNDRSFSLQVAFARHLTHDERLALLRRRQNELSRRLQEGSELQRAGDRYRHAARERSRIHHASELDWLNLLIADELATKETSGAESNTTSETSSQSEIPQHPLPKSSIGGSLP